MGTCFYYEEKEKPQEHDEGVMWLDPEDGSDPFPDLVTFMNGEWLSAGIDGDLEPIIDLGDILCIQKLKLPDVDNLLRKDK